MKKPYIEFLIFNFFLYVRGFCNDIIEAGQSKSSVGQTATQWWGKTANSRQCSMVPNYGIHCIRWIKCIFHLSRGSWGGIIVLDTVSPLPVSLAVSILQQSVQILCKTTKIESGKSSTKWHKNYKSSNCAKLKKLCFEKLKAFCIEHCVSSALIRWVSLNSPN